MPTYLCPKDHDCKRLSNGRCLICNRLQVKAYRKRYPGKHRNLQLRSKYGIDLKEYNRLFQAQHGLCAGCYKHQSHFKLRFAVDHNHTTNKIRGLLCANCNQTIGLVYDNPDTLRRLASYLSSL